MGMTIDKAIKCLRQWLKNGSNGLTDTRLGYIEGWFHKSDKEAYMTAIETMRKYQKIEQIIKDHDNDRIPEDYWYIDKIREVVEKGNDD